MYTSVSLGILSFLYNMEWNQHDQQRFKYECAQKQKGVLNVLGINLRLDWDLLCLKIWNPIELWQPLSKSRMFELVVTNKQTSLPTVWIWEHISFYLLYHRLPFDLSQTTQFELGDNLDERIMLLLMIKSRHATKNAD